MGMGATSYLQLLSPGDLGTSSFIHSTSLPGTLSLMMIFVYGLNLLLRQNLTCLKLALNSLFITGHGLELLILLPYHPRVWITGTGHYTQFMLSGDQTQGFVHTRQVLC